MEQNPTVLVALKDIGSPELHISLTSVLFQRVKPAHCVRRMAHHPRHQLIILFQKHTGRRQLIIQLITSLIVRPVVVHQLSVTTFQTLNVNAFHIYDLKI